MSHNLEIMSQEATLKFNMMEPALDLYHTDFLKRSFDCFHSCQHVSFLPVKGATSSFTTVLRML